MPRPATRSRNRSACSGGQITSSSPCSSRNGARRWSARLTGDRSWYAALAWGHGPTRLSRYWDSKSCVSPVRQAPVVHQPFPVGPAVPGGPAVVHLGDADAAAGEIADLEVVHHRHVAGG